MTPQKIITEKESIIDIDKLKKHPSVTKIIEGPFDFVCFGFCNKQPNYEMNPNDWREMRSLMLIDHIGVTAISINEKNYLYYLTSTRPTYILYFS